MPVRIRGPIPVVFFRLDSGREPVREWLERQLVLLHGFVKKSRKAPTKELTVARRRLRKLRSE